MNRHSAWALPLALFQLFSVACVEDLADGFSTTATVTASDGTTPLAHFSASSYEVIFHLKDGLNVARTYVNADSGTGITTDSNGVFSITKADVELYTIQTGYECYDTCVAWDRHCDYDRYHCHDYCTWYVTDCYERTYVPGVDMNYVASVSTYLNYAVGASNVRTQGTSISDFYDAAANRWVRDERFVTPISVVSASQAFGSQPAEIPSLPQPKRTGCDAQDELSEEQMAKVRALRDSLGVSPAEVACRK